MSAPSRPTFDYAVRLFDNGPAVSERSPPTAEHLARVQDCLSRVAQLYGDKKYIAGEQVTYGDLMVAGTLNMLMTLLTDEEKGQVFEWEGGRWKAMIDEFEGAGYTKTDQGEVYVPH
jgi:glutathione S-transferase